MIASTRLPVGCTVGLRPGWGVGCGGVGDDDYVSINHPVVGWLQERGVFLGSLKALTPEMDGKLDRL